MKKYSLLFLTITILFVFAEIICRIYINYIADDKRFLFYASFEQLKSRSLDLTCLKGLKPHRYLGYYPCPNYIDSSGQNRHNSLGYRGTEINPKKRQG